MWHNEPNKHYKKQQGYWLLRCNQVVIQAETEPGFVITINQPTVFHALLSSTQQWNREYDRSEK